MTMVSGDNICMTYKEVSPMYIESKSEKDAVTMRLKQNETQPSRAPRGLRFGWLVDQYMSSLSSKN